MTQPTATLTNGVAIPMLGFGVYQVLPEECERVVIDAIASGYRHIDTAAAYFNEEQVGRAIRASSITREVGYMQANGITVAAWGSFAEGKNDFFNQPLLVEIDQKYGKTAGQVALRWLYQRDIASLVKTVRPERMRENQAIFDFELNSDDMLRLTTLDTGHSALATSLPNSFFDHRDPNFARWLTGFKNWDV